MLVGKIKFILFTLIILAFPCFMHVHAECSYERQAELSRIAGNVQFSYTYELDEINNRALFSINISNVPSDIYIQDDFGDRYTQFENTITTYTQGEKNFEIYSNDANCYGELLLTKRLDLPIYNMFYGYDECKENKDFVYCSLWGNYATITKDVFNKELNLYKAQKESTYKGDINKQNDFEKILELLKQNYYIFIIITVLILAIVLYKKIGGKK